MFFTPLPTVALTRYLQSLKRLLPMTVGTLVNFTEVSSVSPQKGE